MLLRVGAFVCLAMQRYRLIVVWGVLGYHFWLFCPKEALFLEEETVSGISFEDGTGAVVAQAVAGGPGWVWFEKRQMSKSGKTLFRGKASL